MNEAIDIWGDCFLDEVLELIDQAESEVNESNPDILMGSAKAYYESKLYHFGIRDTDKVITFFTNKEKRDYLKLFKALKLNA